MTSFLTVICVVSRGSVVVTFSLRFSQLIDVKEVEQVLGAGLQRIEGGVLVIDTKTISITGECVMSQKRQQLLIWR